jgi:predicted metal-binding membrane protein
VILALAGASVAAWILMTPMLASGGMPATGDGGPLGGAATTDGAAGWTCVVPGMGTGNSGGGDTSMLLSARGGAGIAMWALMVVAMMLPTALPAVAHVSANSLRSRRRRAMASFVAVYLLIWVGFGALLIAAFSAAPSVDGAVALAIALLIAAMWQLTPHKRRAVRDCHRSYPLAPRGWPATTSVVSFALRNGTACLRSCWAMMLAMALAPSGMVIWMAAIAGLVVVDRSTRTPRRTARTVSALLASGALFVIVSQLIV